MYLHYASFIQSSLGSNNKKKYLNSQLEICQKFSATW